MVRLVAFFFAGGDAFFCGVALLAVAAVLSSWANVRSLRTGFRLATAIAAIVIAALGTPLPLWFYALGGGAIVLMFLPRRGQTSADARPRHRRLCAALVLLWCVAAAAWELSYRFPPLPDQGTRYGALVVIGDSISAGMLGPAEQTWPKQFRKRYRGTVIDLSTEGATTDSAIRQAQILDAKYPHQDAVVLVEIGGNDFFELVSPADFARNLDRLLSLLERSNRRILLLELPLPPFYNVYGRVQRDLAAKHRIPLISKREFAGVGFTQGATLDTVHLSETGHGLMAAMIWRYVGQLLK